MSFRLYVSLSLIFFTLGLTLRFNMQNRCTIDKIKRSSDWTYFDTFNCHCYLRFVYDAEFSKTGKFLSKVKTENHILWVFVDVVIPLSVKNFMNLRPMTNTAWESGRSRHWTRAVPQAIVDAKLHQVFALAFIAALSSNQLYLIIPSWVWWLYQYPILTSVCRCVILS